MSSLKIFSGNANPALAREIAGYLGLELGQMRLGRFSDGEIDCAIQENVRGCDVFVIQPTSPPVNEHLMELLIMLDAFRRASARRMTAVIPYFGYSRQDKKDKPRVPITAKLVADLITAAGASRALCMDLHSLPIQGYFNLPVDNLFAAPVIIEYVESLQLRNLTVVSPDAGGVSRARAIAKRLDAQLAIVDKRRESANVAEVMHIVGDVDGRNTVIYDDMIDTAGTICEAARALKKAGAQRVFACAAHPVLSGPALDRILNSELEQVVVTNTIPLDDSKHSCSRIKVLSVAQLFGEAIRRIREETSISSLFV
ncbi:MAG TPA: ribose-phosphate pyrophosphokinase [Acidobacteriota bacterium]|jgi:ribose-phosphate pyrophosphokinase